MKQMKLALIFVTLTLASCVSRNHRIEFNRGTFYSSSSFSCEDNYFINVKIVIDSVPKVYYDYAQGIDVIEDMATPTSARDFYRFRLFFSTSDEEYIHKTMTYIAPSTRSEGSNTYFIGVKLFENQEEYRTRVTLHGGSYEIDISGYIHTYCS